MSGPKGPTPTSSQDYTKQIGDRFVDPKLVPRLYKEMEAHGIGRDHPVLGVIVLFLETMDAVEALDKVVRGYAEGLARDSAATRLAASTLLERMQPLVTLKADLERFETTVAALGKLQSELQRINARLAAIDARQAPSSRPFWQELTIFSSFAWATFATAKIIVDFFKG